MSLANRLALLFAACTAAVALLAGALFNRASEMHFIELDQQQVRLQPHQYFGVPDQRRQWAHLRSHRQLPKLADEPFVNGADDSDANGPIHGSHPHASPAEELA